MAKREAYFDRTAPPLTNVAVILSKPLTLCATSMRLALTAFAFLEPLLVPFLAAATLLKPPVDFSAIKPRYMNSQNERSPHRVTVGASVAVCGGGED
jgi:hypothetical protein